MSTERIVVAVIMSIVLGGVGYAVGQYFPFLSDLAQLGEPFSPVRNQVAPGYAMGGAVVGIVIGLLVKPSGTSSGDS